MGSIAAPGMQQPVQYSTKTTTATTVKPSGVAYYVRVCALKDPSSFDAKKLEGVKGRIEKWPIGSTTSLAIMLTGFSNLEDAIESNEKLHARGFPDSYILKEEKGKMTKFKY